MTRFLRHTRLSFLTVLLAFGGLALAPSVSLTAHAATGPTITATGGYSSVSVTGYNFTPNGSVLVRVYNSNGYFMAYTYTTALGPHNVCSPTPNGRICYRDGGGEINTGMNLQGGNEDVHVIAYDYGSRTWSNWSTTFVRVIK